MSDHRHDPASERASSFGTDEPSANAAPEQSRRDLLAQAGRFAAYTAPAMIVLLSPEDAAACHSNGNDLIGCPSP
jgi:hypothetical protein